MWSPLEMVISLTFHKAGEYNGGIFLNLTVQLDEPSAAGHLIALLSTRYISCIEIVKEREPFSGKNVFQVGHCLFYIFNFEESQAICHSTEMTKVGVLLLQG